MAQPMSDAPHCDGLRAVYVGRMKRSRISSVLIGLVLGVAIGMALDNLVAGIGIGIALAIALGWERGGRER